MKEASCGKLEIGCGLAWWLGHLVQNPEVPGSNLLLATRWIDGLEFNSYMSWKLTSSQFYIGFQL